MAELLTKDDLLIILYRMVLTLRNTALCGPNSTFSQELMEKLGNPEPGDLVMRHRIDNDPVALKIAKLVFSIPATENNPCSHTVMLMDGSVTTWRNERIYKIPTAVFVTRQPR